MHPVIGRHKRVQSTEGRSSHPGVVVAELRRRPRRAVGRARRRASGEGRGLAQRGRGVVPCQQQQQQKENFVKL